MGGIGLVALVALMGYAVGRGRHDVALTVLGYLVAAISILIVLFFTVAYLYVVAVTELWNWSGGGG
jgi:hypothetical protein